MKKLLLVIAVFLTSFSVKSQCNYEVELWDSWGDGWNGNNLEVYIDGVLDDTHTLSGGQSGVFPIIVSSGQQISFVYDASGSFPGENAYQLTDSDGAIIYTSNASYGMGPSSGGSGTPGDSGPFTAACPPPPTCDYNVELWDSWGDGWNGNNLEVYIDGVLDNTYSLTGGQSGFYPITVSTGQQITFIYDASGQYQGENAYQLTDPTGAIIYTSNASYGLGPSSNGSGTPGDSGPFATACPSCSSPAGLTASSITGTGATLSWSSSETTFDIGFGSTEPLAGDTVGVTDTFLVVNNLSVSTTYEYWVRADCGTSGASSWSGPYEFFTGHCVPVATGTSTATYIDDFSTSGGSGGVDISNLGSGRGLNGYEDNFSSLRVESFEGQSFDFALQEVSGTIGCAIWIDWDEDLSFDASDIVYQSSGYTSAPSGTITIPVGTSIGQKRMRVIIDWNDSTPEDTPCSYDRGEAEDYMVDVVAPPPVCAGTPAVTNTTSTDTLICSGVGFTVSLETPPTDLGYTYQWQSSSDGITYNDIVSGTSATFDTSILADTWFQCVVTCSTSGLSSTSSPVQITLDDPQNCYCEPVYGTTANSGCLDGDVIARVILNTLDNNSGTGCPSGTAGYSDYTDSLSLTTTLSAGSTYGCTVYAGQWGEGYKAWIDYNQDGVFDNSPVGTPGSEVVGNTTTPVPGSGSVGVLGGNVTFPISLSCNPTPGTYRLRIRCIFNNSGPSIDPCIYQSNWGETEDYLITIAPPPPCPVITNLAVNNVGYSSASLTWLLGCAETVWDVSVSTDSIPGAPANFEDVTSDSLFATGLNDNTVYYAHVRADCETSGAIGNGESAWTTIGPFTTLESCVAPTALTAFNVGSDSALVSWSSDSTLFDVAFGQAPFALPTDFTAGYGSLASDTVILSGLAGGTNYQYYVRTNCGTNDQSDWSGPFSFTTEPEECSGTPSLAGVNVSSSDTVVCSQLGFTLSLENVPTVLGYTYQWQSSSDGITYNDIATGTSATFDTSIVADTWFQCVVTCTNSGLSNSTTPLNIILDTNVQECYCEPVYGTTANSGCLDGDVIARVILNTLDNNSGTGCPSGTAGYSDYTDSLSLTTTLSAGSTYGCTVYAGQWSEGYKAWIDYNQDGVFDNSPVGTPGSEVIGNTTSPVPGSGSVGVLGGNVTFPITLACNPTPGTYRLRIRCIFNNSGPSIDPCIYQSNWGETEDYLISIAPPPPCPDILGLVASNVTTNSADIDWVQGCAETVWNYEVSTSSSPPVAGVNVGVTTQIAGGLTPGTTYYAHVRALCGNSNVSNWSTVSFTTQSVAPANDSCFNAIELTCGQIETVNTTAATSEASTGACGSGTGGTPGIGVWYTFTGTGDEVQVSLCNSDFDTKLHIYTSQDGTCNTLSCFESNDDGPLCPSLQSAITFNSVLGTKYYILPNGFSTSTGNLEIGISCIPQGVNTWLGTSTDDDDPANWSTGSLPDCSTDIFIPLTANNPTFDSLFECNNFGMASTANALVLAADDTLAICGDVTIAGNASITGPGWVSLNGTNGGTSITGSAGTTISNLMLTSNYSVVNNLDITNVLLLNGGNIDATGGTITLKSDINGTAYFDDFSEIGGTYTGDLTQERYVATSTVSGGISTGQRLFGTAVSNGSVSGLNQQYANYPNGLGALVPTAACDPTILDANSPYSNLFEWDESAPTSCFLEGWTAISDASTLTSSRGYSGWMDLGSVISVTGTPNTGAQSFAGSTSGNVANASGWHVLSNPFPSPINVSAITTGGFTSAQFYDNTTAFAGTYQPMLVGMTEIPIMQGFIAQATSPSTFDVSNSDRIATNNPEFYKSNNWFDYKLEVIVNVNQSQDITYLYYSDIATSNFDSNGDCVKRESDVNKPTLYTRNNTQMLSLNGLHLNDLGMSVPMGLIAQSQSAASLSFTGMTDFPVNTTIYLEDKVNGVFHNIINGDYTFTADPAENGTDRFEIHFVLPASFNLVEPTCENTNGTIIDNTNDGREYNIFNDGFVVGLGVLDGSSNELAAGDYTIEVYDQYGGSQVYDITVDEITSVTAGIISSASAIESGESIDFEFSGSNALSYEWSINGQVVAQTELFSFEFTTPGQYVVEVFAANDICDAVATRIIDVVEKTTAVIEIGNGSLSIYESDGDVVLNFTNINQGKVQASIYNLLGQELASVGLESSGKQTIQNVNWADGYYLVKVQIGQQVVNETILITKK